MSSRHRTCGHLVPSVSPTMPPPATLARLAPLMAVLMDCASAFDEIDEDGTYTAVEWVTWLDLEVRQLPSTIPHGTRTGYLSRGCRCPECKQWRSAYYNVHPVSA